MDQPSPRAQLASLQQGASFDPQRDKKIPQVIPTAPSTHEEASSTVVPYRLYKRRWVGVVAMVNPFQLFLILG